MGLVASINRPGGNVTGTLDQPNLVLSAEPSIYDQATLLAIVGIIQGLNPLRTPQQTEAMVAADTARTTREKPGLPSPPPSERSPAMETREP